MSSHCVGDETVPPLPVGPHISTHDRPRPTAVACSAEDGGPPGRWALAIQEFSETVYRKGIANGNAEHCQEENQKWKHLMQP